MEPLGLTADDFVVEVLRVRLLDGEPAMIERSTFIEPVGSLLFEFDTDSGSMTDYLASRGVYFDSMEHVLDAVAAGPDDAANPRYRAGQSAACGSVASRAISTAWCSNAPMTATGPTW